MSKTKNKIVALIIMFSFPMMLFFQNCSQQGSLQLSNGTQIASNSMAVGDDIPRDIPTDDPANSGDGMVIVPPSLPPTDIPPQDSHDDDDDIVQTQDCHGIKIADMRLVVESVGTNSSCLNKNKAGADDNRDFEIADLNSSAISLSQPILKIRALKNIEVKQLFVRLSESGNQVLSMDNIAMDLVTPSAQQSGLKFQLESSIKVEAGRNYELKFNIRIEDQFVVNSVKCILKPVIKSAQLVPSN